MFQNKRYFRALSIAGSDSGGGAGIQADLKTFAAHGCYGMSVITAVTAQNTQGVRAVFPLPEDLVQSQIETVLEDIGADAIKIGMLASPALICAVAECLKAKARGIPIVFDPVMIAQSGDSLAQKGTEKTMQEQLVPLSTLITPNLFEAGKLLGREIATKDAMAEAARELAGLGCANVLVKGGHLADEACDLLFLGGEQKFVRLPGKRLATRNDHGTGCTLSSAIAANLARGHCLERAVCLGKEYVTQALAKGAAYTIGRGRGPVHHFYALWNKED